jgi:predicted nucleotidyltransferase
VTLEELRRSNKEQILKLAEAYGARNVRVFGSVARGDATADSDIDFLVELDPDRTLMDLGGLLMEIGAILGTRVDVATEGMLRPHVLRRALEDAVPL